MSLMIVPEAMKAKLAKADAPIEMCSSDGRVLGYFTPAKAGRKLNLDPGISDEELMRRVAEEDEFTLVEIFRELEAGK